MINDICESEKYQMPGFRSGAAAADDRRESWGSHFRI